MFTEWQGQPLDYFCRADFNLLCEFARIVSTSTELLGTVLALNDP